ncbi:J domain-containing protein [Hymenobacter sp. BT18]|uniref:J domain-containing protein n=1 Tax=Hymenobacter sp. BT18 TaxID=2835648 RepID=UPI00143E96CE|nr:J domain-containing protein [Hymenobacter sp. BT18]QIX61925.1 J domain-containing protein [Hymenobacter sp. BT18]
MITYYAVLELSEQAAAAEIRRAYLHLVRLTHPDRTADPAAHQRYLAVNEAYETLSDPIRRQRYDAALQQAQKLPAPAPPTNYRSRAQRTPPPTAFRRRARIRVLQVFDYHSYSGRARRWCQLLLLLPCLILVDYFVLRREVQANFLTYADKSNVNEPGKYEIGTSHGHFITSVDIPLSIPHLQLRISPIGHFVFAAQLPDGTPLPVHNEVSVLAVFSGILLVIAGSGWRASNAQVRVNLAIIGSVVALILLLMLLKRL